MQCYAGYIMKCVCSRGYYFHMFKRCEETCSHSWNLNGYFYITLLESKAFCATVKIPAAIFPKCYFLKPKRSQPSALIDI